MLDHDLTKSRLVQVALAYCWEWPKWAPSDRRMKTLAMAFIRKGHCEMEDHHPEYEVVGHGPLSMHKLFADRLAVHLQKDPRDDRGGWAILPHYIPEKCEMAWETFRAAYGHINLYTEALDIAHQKWLWKRNRFEEDTD